jgi:predicted ArsR family transcriptional regulator
MDECGTEVKMIRSGRKNAVLEMLSTKNDKGELEAFTQGEIAKKLGIRPQHARQILMDLVQKNIVVRKQVKTAVRDLVFYALSDDVAETLDE